MDDVADVFKSVGKTTNQLAEFKKPVVIGRRPGVKLPGKPSERVEQNQGNLHQSALETNVSPKIASSEKSLEDVEPVSNLPLKSATVATTKNLNLNYVPPPSSSICELPYKLEVLKDGVIVQSEDLQNKKPYLVFGRLPSCDVVLQHPSISRYHAILQYKLDSNQNMGWHLFDLESTHGTYLNKQQIPPSVHCRVRSGHIFKMGVSTRLFILQGPEEDQEPISELSISQLKELKLKRASSIEKLDNGHESEEQFSDKSEASAGSSSTNSGITWGMREDAEDENPLAENPFAMTDDVLLNENLYLDDPKKSLRGWFEREGYELEYKVEEKNYAHFICRVELPIESPNGAPIVAEASVKGGKKKEAVVQCALEACRILDRHGVLRQSKHESKVRPRKRQYDDDYYSSDEDTFLDRTGTVERKRQARMKEKLGDSVETYESLSLKLQNVTKEIANVQLILNTTNVSARKSTEIDTDDIDSYVKALQTEESRGKKSSAAALRLQLNQLQKEETKLKALVNIARPSITMSAPPVEFPLLSATKQIEEKSSTSVCEKSEREFGSTDKSIDVAEENTSKNILKPIKSVAQITSDSIAVTIPKSFKQPKEKELLETSEGASSSPADPSSVLDDSEKVGLVIRKQKKRGVNKSKSEWTGNAGATNKTTLDNNIQDDDSKYAMWTPPEDQSGDGKTSLNRKYGY